MRQGIFACFIAVSAIPALASANNTALLSFTLDELLSVKVKSTSYFDEALHKTSYNVTPTSRQQWHKLGVRNLGELLNHMPSTVAPLGFGQSRVVAIRGYLNNGSPTGTAVRFDGVPMNKLREGGALMALDGYDLSLLQSTELIRGPGSSLHGNDAFHGVLSLETIEPQETQLRLDTELGTLDYRAAAISGHLQADDNGLTLALAYRNIGDMRQPYEYTLPDRDDILTSERKNARESANGLLKYRFDDEVFSIEASAFVLDFKADELPGIGDPALIGNQRDEDFSAYHDTTQLLRVAGDYQFNLSSSLTFLSYYWRYKDQFEADFRRIPSIGIKNSAQREENHWGAQVHKRYRFSSESHLTFGYEFLSETLDDSQLKIIGADGRVLSSVISPAEIGYKRSVHSLVLDGQQRLNREGLSMNYGFRWDAYNDFDEQLSPRLGFTQTLAAQQTLHITYASAFRAPSAFELLGDSQIIGNGELQPETLESLDIKYTLQGPQQIHTLTVFENRWHEAIRNELSRVDGNLQSQFINTGSNTSHGIEYELNARWPHYELDLATSYIRSENNDTSQPFDAFPHWIADLNLGYLFSQHWSLYCSNRYMLRDAYAARITTEDKNITYFRSDVSLTWKQHGISLGLVIRNSQVQPVSAPQASL